MKRIINKEPVSEAPISFHDVSGRDIVMVSTRLKDTNGTTGVIVIGAISPHIENGGCRLFTGILYCIIDYYSKHIKDFDLIAMPYNMTVPNMETDIMAGKLRAYVVVNLQDAKEVIQDILVWHGFPK